MDQPERTRAFRSGALSADDYVGEVEAAYAAHEPAVQAFIPEEDRFERLCRDAQALLSRYPDASARPALFGSLVGVKDIFHVQGFVTHAGSQLPAEELQGLEASSVTRLKEAGALILGKTVTTEFAYFSPGPTRNPRNLDHTPGGSSSGSAAAVAEGLCDITLGTQTIGSIIRPASFCGVPGFKPTYERVARDGVIPLSPALDHVGCFGASLELVRAAARLLITDWTEIPPPSRLPVLGIPEGSYLQSASAEGLSHFENVCAALASKFEIRPVTVMADFAEIRARHDLILSAQAAKFHAEWFAKYEDRYSAKFAELIGRGRSIAPAQVEKALRARDEFRNELGRVMQANAIDIWICPATLGPAPAGLASTGDPIMDLPWTQAGLPALNVPAGADQAGLPIGLQLVSAWGADELLLAWAGEIEKLVGSR
jgi:Asp-tRNA(Asn)/Glu-tRNA(Gln) amidotransferase A subunit family amidase